VTQSLQYHETDDDRALRPPRILTPEQVLEHVRAATPFNDDDLLGWRDQNGENLMRSRPT
jgi:hypothetical protein